MFIFGVCWDATFIFFLRSNKTHLFVGIQALIRSSEFPFLLLLPFGHMKPYNHLFPDLILLYCAFCFYNYQWILSHALPQICLQLFPSPMDSTSSLEVNF